MGEKVYRQGHTAGIAPESWDTIRRNKVFLKAPITTPSGGGYKSLNVTIRKTLNLFANVRPTKSYAPFVASPHPGMNLVVIRENEEDLYAGIEHQQTDEVVQVLKLVTRPGSERIIRYAFEYARAYGRRRVTCMTKDTIMKHADGLFHRVFDEIAAEYPDLESDHQIIDIGAARVAAQPEQLDVVVTLNLYGDILSDIAAQVAGSVGLASSANIGEDMAMFEAVHGSAPDIAGKDVANPSGLLLTPVQYRAGGISVTPRRRPGAAKQLAGVDVFLDWADADREPQVLGRALEGVTNGNWRLKMITNRGVKVYPDGLPETFRTDHWRCRFVPRQDAPAAYGQVVELLGAVHGAGFDVIKTENL